MARKFAFLSTALTALLYGELTLANTFPDNTLGRWEVADGGSFIEGVRALEIAHCAGEGFCALLIENDRCDGETVRLRMENFSELKTLTGVRTAKKRKMTIMITPREQGVQLVVSQEPSPLSRSIMGPVYFLSPSGRARCAPNV